MADQILQTAQAVLRDPSVKMFLSQLSGQISRAIEEKLAAIGIKPVAGAEAEDTAAEKPVLSEAQKIKLDKAKYRMDRAEKSLKEYQTLKNKFFTKWFVGVSSLKAETEVEREYQTAKVEYDKLRKEFGV
jgi:hypothetical protein